MRRACLGVFVLAVAAGCTEQQNPVSVENPAGEPSLALAAPRGDYMPTPAGWYHRSCVHEVPDSARLRKGGLVIRRDGSSYRIPKCAYPSFRSRPNRVRPGFVEPSPPVNNGWIEYAHSALPEGNWYRWLSASWAVPATPAGSYSGGQVYYTFPGLESDSFINQPVLEYNRTGWWMASWHCDDGDNCTHSAYKRVYPGDAMYGKVVASDCANGLCAWWIHTFDVTRGTQTVFSVQDTEDYWWATGGALEVYGLTSCSQYGGSGVSYSSVTLLDRNDNVLSPTWTYSIQSGTYPNCGWDVTSTSSSVSLFYNLQQPLSNSIVNENTYFYTAVPSGGYPPYSNYWEWCGIDCGGGGGGDPVRGGAHPTVIARGWQFLSTDWTVYWTESQRYLRSTVTDSHNQQAVAVYWVP